MSKKIMTSAEFELLLAKYKVEFEKEFAKQSEKVIHVSLGKTYTYLNKKSKLKITYNVRYHDGMQATITVNHITTQSNLQALYGHTDEYGHNVYMTVDADFIGRIVSIEKL